MSAAPMTYTGLAYSNPVCIIFHALFRSRVQRTTEGLAAQYREGAMTYVQGIPPPFESGLYQPLLKALHWLTARARVIQSGNINQYIASIFVIVLIVLILRALLRTKLKWSASHER